MFKVQANFKPTGDQPQAIAKLVKNLKAGARHNVLLGVTGSGKTATISWVIEKIQKPSLIVSHNKVLAAQLFQEFKEFFPEAAVHYFVSYYDYYQPEAYIPQTDTYIEKDAKINETIDRLRHAAVQDLLSRKDIIIVASVSCIYNIGSPDYYQDVSLEIKEGKKIKRKDFLRHLTGLQYQRNDIDFKPGTFRVRGEVVEIYLVTGKEIIQVEFLENQIERISKKSPNMQFSEVRPRKQEGRYGEVSRCPTSGIQIFPGHFWVTPEEKLQIAIENIKLELQERLKELKKQKKLLEAQRLEQRTNYDLEMLRETGFCHGIENYSRHLEFRQAGAPPFTLIDYFSFANRHESTFANIRESQIRENSRGFLVFIDESHQTLPQLHAMAVQDRARKETLIEYGFRLRSAIDNRPLTFEEIEKKIKEVVCVSATPSSYEINKAEKEKIRLNSLSNSRIIREAIVEQLIRPTGLLEPSIEIRKTKNQVKDLIREIKKRIKKRQRTLVLTLTKRLAEDLAEYLAEQDIKTQWLHSEVKTLERPQILKDLRQGKYDVLVGINLLREGLDLPEVALIAILDADKEGFLRSETTLIQTMGRAARHLEGHVILYADKVTRSMSLAIKEVNRRRKIQERYNKTHNISPKPIIKEIRDWPFIKKEKEIIGSEFGLIRDAKLLEKEMKTAARNLDFERAAEIRDLIRALEKEE